jgi:cytochrome c oxidase cbb3-type subunit III
MKAREEMYMNCGAAARSTARRACVVAMVALCAMLLSGEGVATSQETPQQKQGTPADSPAGLGRLTFESTCASCHGLDGRGGERGPDIASRADVLRLTDREILQVLRDGIPSAGMPAFGFLGSAKLSALLGYLRTLQGKGSAAAIPGDPEEGQRLFSGAARCSECHMVHGQGGFIASDLSAYAANLAASEIRSAITNPGGNSSEPRTLVTATLRDDRVIEGIVRNDDNFSLQLQSVDGTFHFLQKSDVAKVEPHAKPLMPADYGSRLTPAQLDDLVGYLMSVARQTKSQSPADPEREDD